ncbi:hypothetical protein RB201_25885 [Streptomyces sp. S1A(2023)]
MRSASARLEAAMVTSLCRPPARARLSDSSSVLMASPSAEESWYASAFDFRAPARVLSRDARIGSPDEVCLSAARISSMASSRSAGPVAADQRVTSAPVRLARQAGTMGW